MRIRPLPGAVAREEVVALLAAQRSRTHAEQRRLGGATALGPVAHPSARPRLARRLHMLDSGPSLAHSRGVYAQRSASRLQLWQQQQQQISRCCGAVISPDRSSPPGDPVAFTTRPDAHAVLEAMCGPVIAVGRHTKSFPR